MKLLLDTQIVQWLALDRQMLNRAERQLLASPRHSFVISAVSIWEMRTKWQTFYRSNDRKGEADPERVIETLAASSFSYERLPMLFEHCLASLRHPLVNGDQVDRVLLAQAQVEGLRLFTRDHKFESHPLALFA